jgi:hypothetical protein
VHKNALFRPSITARNVFLKPPLSGPDPGRKKKLTDAQHTELKKRFEAGESRAELAREFGVDRVTVHRYAGR